MTKPIQLILALSALAIAVSVTYALVVYPIQRDRYVMMANRECLSQSSATFDEQQRRIMEMLDAKHPLVTIEDLETGPKEAADNMFKSCLRGHGLD